MKIKTRSELRGIHVHTTVFMQGDLGGSTLQNCGTLITSEKQARTLRHALKAGMEELGEDYEHEERAS